jgi:hypothetical protein
MSSAGSAGRHPQSIHSHPIADVRRRRGRMRAASTGLAGIRIRCAAAVAALVLLVTAVSGGLFIPRAQDSQARGPAHSLCRTQILTPQEARPFVRPLPHLADLPESIDWRDRGVITPARNQQTCGGCWAFAAIACVEAMCILRGASPSLDLSEQHPISCDRDPWLVGNWRYTNDGCCGGSAVVFEFLKEYGAVLESGFPFGNGDHDGPGDCHPSVDWNLVPCPAADPDPSGWRVTSWSIVSEYVATVEQMKTALQLGPVWCAFWVYSDFYPVYWNSNQTDTPYRHVTSSELPAGHAVLVIGYDDEQQCWIVKNSWGPTGPFGDGTFRIAYDNNCSFGLNAVICEVDGATPVQGFSLGRLRMAYR